tara:strand:- start:287 stop:511 length:225 start_codon:yes stop_codon:yes gene_type:complete
MANRLRKDQIELLKQGAQVAQTRIINSDWEGAVIVQQALLEQLIELIEGVDFNNEPDPDVVITFKEDCGDANGA